MFSVRRSALAIYLTLCLTLTSLGCGSKGQPLPPPATDPVEIKSQLKPTLESLASTGQKSSAFSVIEGKIKQLEAADAALATSLREEYEKMTKTSSASEIKASAKKMLEKL